MTAAAETSDPRVEYDLIRALLARTPGVVFSNVLASLLVAAVLYGHAGLPVIVWWLIFIALQAGRVWVWKGFERDPQREQRALVWARRHAACLLVIGVAYGLPTLLFFPEHDAISEIFCLSVIAVTAMGAVMTTVGYPPSLITFSMPALAQAAIRCWMEDGIVFDALAVVFVTMIPMLAYFSVAQTRSVRNALLVRYENMALVEQLREQKQAAERANLAKSRFFAAASHDLRQPLQALGLFAASLRDAERRPEDSRKFEQILSSVDALESLFDELLDVSRLDAGYVQPNIVHVDTERLFTRLEAAYGPVAAKNGLELRFRKHPPVLLSDAILLERVLGNLISNALRYTLKGGVLVGWRRRGKQIRLEVWDTGIGIPRAEFGHIFDEFYQLGNPERDRRHGLGLGLATVKRVAALLNCPLSLNSEPGRGSVFRMTVPEGDPAAVVRVLRPAFENIDALAGKVIAVIEDEGTVREGLATLLEQWHCRPVATASAQETIDVLALQGLVPDVILADYRLRDHQTGITAIEMLRARFGAEIPALLVSGDTTEELFRAARESSLIFIAKPISSARLRAALLHFLSKRAATDAAAPDKARQ
jgi:signal transduction histidine kinase/CheY-like chemotaxis protein